MTIYDIVKEAGVCASTVSRVITDQVSIVLGKVQHQKVRLPSQTGQAGARFKPKIIGILVDDLRTASYGRHI